jgi:hypothetical protein
MKPTYLLTLGVLACAAIASLASAQKPAPAQPTEQQKPNQPADHIQPRTKGILTDIPSLITMLGAGLAAYFGSYLKKKGENLATRGDIGKLVEQVAAVTQTTKEIEARISNEIWDRQKRWELKRDVLFDASKRLSELNDAVIYYATAASVQPQNTEAWNKTFSEAAQRALRATEAYHETMSLTTVVCTNPTREALHQFGIVAGTISNAAGRGDPAAFNNSSGQLAQRLGLAVLAIRKELQID